MRQSSWWILWGNISAEHKSLSVRFPMWETNMKIVPVSRTAALFSVSHEQLLSNEMRCSICVEARSSLFGLEYNRVGERGFNYITKRPTRHGANAQLQYIGSIKVLPGNRQLNVCVALQLSCTRPILSLFLPLVFFLVQVLAVLTISGERIHF